VRKNLTISSSILISFLLLLAPSFIFSQSKEQLAIDSMLAELPHLTNDTNKSKLLASISGTYFTINPDKGIIRGQQALALAEQFNWEKGKAKAYSSLGANYWAKGNSLKAQDCYWEALKINEAVKDAKEIAHSFHSLAVLYETEGDRLKALEYFEKSLEIEQKNNYKYDALGCLANIASLYAARGKYDSAIYDYEQSIKFCEEVGNQRHIAYMKCKIGTIFALQKQYIRALEYERQSLETFLKVDDKSAAGTALNSIADIYLDKHFYDSALSYYKKTLNMFRLLGGRSAMGNVARCYEAIGQVYFLIATDKKNFSSNQTAKSQEILLDEATDNLDTSIKLSKFLGYKEALRDGYETLSQIQSLRGNYKDALESYTKFITYKDSLNDLEKNKEMMKHEMEFLYGKQKDSLNYINKLQQSELNKISQEKQLATLQLKQQWLYSILVFLSIGLFGFYFLYRYRIRQLQLKNQLTKEKSERELKDAEDQHKINDAILSALRSQMNPHFIFNALNTIQSYVYTNDKRSASNYLNKFSELIRRILDNSSKRNITLQEEIELLHLYIDIEKARFGENLETVIDVDPDLDTEDILVPPMLIQPYIENAIKHGLLHKQGRKNLTVTIKKMMDPEFIEITIDDNGIGREMSMELNKKRANHHSFASDANIRRIDLIENARGKKARLEIIDKKYADDSSAGTKVVIQVPVEFSTIF
jgi:tetratricopeptide (TPR) repeat protein